MTKEHILEEIRRTAAQNGGVPLGKGRFEKETGINEYSCNKYWPTFGEAQREAGFIPNTLQSAHSDEYLFESIIVLIRQRGRFPTKGDYIVKRNVDSEFPSPGCFQRIGNRKEKLEKIMAYAKLKGYDDVVGLCERVTAQSNNVENLSGTTTTQILGEVYLCKSGRYYKIGKTNDTVRRGSELRIQLPEAINLVHSIKTDDPSGVETYWHRRFESKRKKGEWFDLNVPDVQAFKRWKRII